MTEWMKNLIEDIVISYKNSILSENKEFWLWYIYNRFKKSLEEIFLKIFQEYYEKYKQMNMFIMLILMWISIAIPILIWFISSWYLMKLINN